VVTIKCKIKRFGKLTLIFKSYDEIKLVYFFGSRARQENGLLSDYDFAVYFDTKDKKRMFDIKLELFDRLSRLLRTDKIDIVILNLSESPELKYLIIQEGSLIFERKPFKIIVEPNILNEYFDFQKILLRYNLTRA
jgi:predicted nucleotidyltransferase